MTEVTVSATVGEMSATVGEMSTPVGEMSVTVGEMSAIVGKFRSADYHPQLCIYILTVRIHGITCEKPIRI